MKTKNFLPVLLSGAPLIAISANTQQQETERPNIVVILADDLGTIELGCYGGTNLQTPNIDRIANEGIRMTNNYASCAMSVPIRASLYTGLYPARHGSYQNHKATYNNLKSVTHYLSDLGYRVGRTGKNHPSGQAQVYGFETIPGFTVDCVASRPEEATVNGITEFIERDTNEPFCLYVCSIHPHMPWDAGDASQFDPNAIKLPENCVDTEQTRREFCSYLAEIQMLDDEVGKVLKVLEETGTLDNTLVIFLGEQGPQMPFGKWNCYHYSTNSAFIARYPAKISQNTTSDAIVQYEDILPTMIELAGGEPIHELDGISCLDVLFGEKEDHRSWSYGIHNNIPEGTAYPIRSIQDKKYKLILNLLPENEYNIKYMTVPGNTMWSSWLTKAQNDEKAKFLTDRFIKRPAIELYDLENDVWELNNIAHLPEHAERIEIMRSALESWMEQQGDRGILMDTENPEDPKNKIPVAIGSIEDIDTYMRNDMNGNFYLTNDIEIPEGVEWVPIGAHSATDGDPDRFRGIFDGKGYSIKNMQITQGNFKGLFGRIHNAEIKHLNLENVNIKGNTPIGGITGAMIGGSIIQQVSVSGNIEGYTEVGGIAGRIARDPGNTGYNTIQDSYVSANIKATSLSTDMNNPSCAGGIVGYVHSTTGNSVAKVDIQRVYASGGVTTSQSSNIAGNAAGILAFYDNQQQIKMDEVIVLCDTIGSGTSNLFFSRRGVTYNQFELFDKVYAREGIILHYANQADKGVGGQIPDGVIQYYPAIAFKTKDFYTTNLSWDFENVWYIEDGQYPKLRNSSINTSVPPVSDALNYQIVTGKGGINIYTSGTFSATIYDVSGKKVREVKSVRDQTYIPMESGLYLIRLSDNKNSYSDKVIVF